jgi:hypothetical protein
MLDIHFLLYYAATEYKIACSFLFVKSSGLYIIRSGNVQIWKNKKTPLLQSDQEETASRSGSKRFTSFNGEEGEEETADPNLIVALKEIETYEMKIAAKPKSRRTNSHTSIFLDLTKSHHSKADDYGKDVKVSHSLSHKVSKSTVYAPITIASSSNNSSTSGENPKFGDDIVDDKKDGEENPAATINSRSKDIDAFIRISDGDFIVKSQTNESGFAKEASVIHHNSESPSSPDLRRPSRENDKENAAKKREWRSSTNELLLGVLGK